MAGEKKQEFEHAFVTEFADGRGTQIKFKKPPLLVEFAPEKAPTLQCQFYPPKGTAIHFAPQGDFVQLFSPDAELMARPSSGRLISWEGKGWLHSKPKRVTEFYSTDIVNLVRGADVAVFDKAARALGFSCADSGSDAKVPYLSLQDIKNIAGKSLGAAITK